MATEMTETLAKWEQRIIGAAFVALSHENTAGYAVNAFAHGEVSDKEYTMLRELSAQKSDELLRAITNAFAEVGAEFRAIGS